MAEVIGGGEAASGAAVLFKGSVQLFRQLHAVQSTRYASRELQKYAWMLSQHLEDLLTEDRHFADMVDFHQLEVAAALHEYRKAGFIKRVWMLWRVIPAHVDCLEADWEATKLLLSGTYDVIATERDAMIGRHRVEPPKRVHFEIPDDRQLVPYSSVDDEIHEPEGLSRLVKRFLKIQRKGEDDEGARRRFFQDVKAIVEQDESQFNELRPFFQDPPPNRNKIDSLFPCVPRGPLPSEHDDPPLTVLGLQRVRFLQANGIKLQRNRYELVLNEKQAALLERELRPWRAGFSKSSKPRPFGGVLSEIDRVTVDQVTKALFLIPDDAYYFCFAYPAEDISHATNQTTRSHQLERFLILGGFIYLDRDYNFVSTNSLMHDLGVNPFISFRGPEHLSDEAASSLEFQDVTEPTVRQGGAVRFCWISPGKELNGCDGRRWKDGAFAYQLESGRFIFQSVRVLPELLSLDNIRPFTARPPTRKPQTPNNESEERSSFSTPWPTNLVNSLWSSKGTENPQSL